MRATRYGAAVTALALALGLAGCSDDEGRARELARAACTAPAPDAPGYDPQTAELALLRDLANAARTRADIAAEAAALDERWAVVSEASAVLAVAAERILEIRQDGGIVKDEMPAAVWDQIKYASDALVVECRPLVS